ncbi:helix-turn-helix transcriptional regulator [Actinomadura soli]|uniref:Helix-turn-helix transcriptional regulator n=1 Tax=Actinomadura soli TaxID=2508997 RepID=A0A5C4JH47_9ACTN|nr:helix-turn-helix transcriptional regulator [Actinomadura soli]
MASAGDVTPCSGKAPSTRSSSRSLQRRLHQEGTSWREQVEKVRQAEATRLLRDTRLNIDAIAARVGYSDVRALRRAFHRWYGHAPADFRRKLPGR